MAGYVFVHSARSFLVLAAVLGVADGAVPSLNQSLVALVVPSPRKVKVQAAVHAWRNAGFAVGAGMAAAILALHTEAVYLAIFLGDAGTFLVVVAVVATLQAPPSAAPFERASHRTSLRSLRDRQLLIGAAINGILSLHMTLLGVGLPLWLVRHTRAPHALTGGLVALNTVMAVGLQVKLSAGVADTTRALRAMRRSGLALAATCLLLASSAGSDAAVASVALVAATVMLTLGEIWQSAACGPLVRPRPGGPAQLCPVRVRGRGKHAARPCSPSPHRRGVSRRRRRLGGVGGAAPDDRIRSRSPARHVGRRR